MKSWVCYEVLNTQIWCLDIWIKKRVIQYHNDKQESKEKEAVLKTILANANNLLFTWLENKMFSKEQRILLKKLVKRINLKQVCWEYGLSYGYIAQYINWDRFTKKTDMKILEMLLEMQDDNFELINMLSMKNFKSE